MIGILVVCGIPLVGLLALILGIVALVRINRSSGALRGRGLAIGAIVIGALMLLAAPVFLVGMLFLGNSHREWKVEKVEDSDRPAVVRIDETRVRPDVAGLIRSAEACSFDDPRRDILLPLARRADLAPEEQKLLAKMVMTGMDFDAGRTEVLKALIANPAFCPEASAAVSALAEHFDFDSSRNEILKLLAGKSFMPATPSAEADPTPSEMRETTGGK